MNFLPTDAKKVSIEDATVDFFNYTLNGVDTLHFDTSKKQGHPMVNAMAGLKAMNENSQLVMINHHSPEGLFPKIEANYDYSVEDLDSGDVKVVFTYKKGTQQSTDFDDNQCGGGCSH